MVLLWASQIMQQRMDAHLPQLLGHGMYTIQERQKAGLGYIVALTGWGAVALAAFEKQQSQAKYIDKGGML